jgi:hypothetical protein
MDPRGLIRTPVGNAPETNRRERSQPRPADLAVGAAAIAQVLIFAASGSVALLADLVHNFGDALTAPRWESPLCFAASAARSWPDSRSWR